MTVYVGIVSAIVLLAAILALFLFRSLAGREPSHVLVVQASERWVGAELVLSGASLPQPYKAQVQRADRYSVPFFVPGGRYELSVRVGGAEVYRQPVELGVRRQETLTLPAEIPATRPSTRAVQ